MKFIKGIRYGGFLTVKKNAVLANMLDTVKDACFENADGRAGARRTLLATGWISTLVSSVTAGTYLSVLLLAIGADDVYIGYISMITTLCGIIQLFSPLIWERFPRRKPFLVVSSFITNFLSYGVITLIPFLPVGINGKLGIYLAVSVINGVFGAFNSSATNAWTMQSLPLVKRINYTSVSSLIANVITLVASFLAGVFLDAFEAELLSIAALPPALSAVIILRAGSFVLVMISSLLTALFVKEYPYGKTDEEKHRQGLSLLLKPLQNKPFLMTIIIPCMWTFSESITGNFFALHLIENVRMSYTMISAVGMLATPVVLLMTPVWTAILKKHSWVKMLSFSYLIYAFAHLCNVFLAADTQYLYVISTLMAYLVSPCISMVSGNLIYLKLPEEDRTCYFGFSAVATTAFTFLGQTLGTMFVKYTTNLRFVWFGAPICNLQLVSLITTLVGCGIAIYTYRYSRVSDTKI